MLMQKRRERIMFHEKEDPFTHKKARGWTRYVMSALCTLLGCLFWLSAQAGIDTAEPDIGAGQLLLEPVEGGEKMPALMLESEVHFNISGMVAEVSVTQSFRNDSDGWVEGHYVFPLPERAAVNRMQIQVGERIIEGSIKEKQQAKKLYQQAKQAGKRAGLVSQQRPNLFTSQVANIGPGETVSVTLNYIETVAYDQGRFSLRFPMTITPRYIPGNPLLLPQTDDIGTLVTSPFGWAVATDQVPDAPDVTPFVSPLSPVAEQPENPIRITVELDAGMPLQVVESAYHNMLLSRQDNRYRLRLAGGPVAMTQDFSLSWQPQPGQAPRAAVFSEQVAGEDYALLMAVPPVAASKGGEKPAVLPKEAIYLIDTSGSMGGVSIAQAKKSLLFALERLQPRDRFNIISFNSSTHTLFNSAVSASAANLAIAKRYVTNLQAGGGTEMLPALEAALRDEAETGLLRQVMFITDGAVGNEEALFKTIYSRLGNSRLFTVGIGSAPNSHFMRRAAQFGRGSFTYIGDISEVQTKMSALIDKLQSPVISNIEIRWPPGSQVELFPNRIPDLYLGEPLLVAARLSNMVGHLVITGDAAGQPWRQEITLTGVQQHAGVATLWAREKVAGLLDEKTRGRPESDVHDGVLSVALQHQIMSPYTSFVAVEKEVSRPAGETLERQSVSNSQPKGQAAQMYAFPKTATGVELKLIGGVSSDAGKP